MNKNEMVSEGWPLQDLLLERWILQTALRIKSPSNTNKTEMNRTATQEVPVVAAVITELSVGTARIQTASHDEWQAEQTALNLWTAVTNNQNTWTQTSRSVFCLNRCSRFSGTLDTVRNICIKHLSECQQTLINGMTSLKKKTTTTKTYSLE